MMGICPKCGKESNDKFCTECGTAIQPQKLPPQNNKKKLKVWQIVLIVVAALYLIGTVINTAQKELNATETTTSRTTNTQQTTKEVTTKKAKPTKATEPTTEDPSIITSAERAQLQSIAKEVVLNYLKSPSTAEFPGSFFNPYEGWGFTKNDANNFEVSGYVDSQNSFGAMLRSDFYMKIYWNKETGKYTASDITIQ